jgi:hypothetical protein
MWLSQDRLRGHALAASSEAAMRHQLEIAAFEIATRSWNREKLKLEILYRQL